MENLNYEQPLSKSSADGKVMLAAGKALQYTAPMLTAFLFIGGTYGLYMRSLGFEPIYPILMSLLLFAGSMEFIVAGMLLSAFDPLSVLVMTLMVNGRHIFYGISMLQKYSGAGWKKFYLIFAMCDEAFSINYTTNLPEKIDRHWFYFFVSLYLHMFWVMGASLGAFGGGVLGINLQGIEFSMTALFIVIFISQWQQEQIHDSAVLGVAVAVGCLLLFGSSDFMLPFMLVILALLMLLRKNIERKFDKL